MDHASLTPCDGFDRHLDDLYDFRVREGVKAGTRNHIRLVMSSGLSEDLGSVS